MLVKQNFSKFIQHSHVWFTHNAQNTDYDSNIAVFSEDTMCICRNNNKTAVTLDCPVQTSDVQV